MAQKCRFSQGSTATPPPWSSPTQVRRETTTKTPGLKKRPFCQDRLRTNTPGKERSFWKRDRPFSFYFFFCFLLSVCLHSASWGLRPCDGRHASHGPRARDRCGVLKTSFLQNHFARTEMWSFCQDRLGTARVFPSFLSRACLGRRFQDPFEF